MTDETKQTLREIEDSDEYSLDEKLELSYDIGQADIMWAFIMALRMELENMNDRDAGIYIKELVSKMEE